METLKQTQVLPIGTHRGWIPKTDWPELEAWRERQLAHLDIEHASESSVWIKYEAIKAEHAANLRAGRTPYNGEAPKLEPDANELANARLEHETWMNGLVEIVDGVKATVEQRGPGWLASFGNVEGLFQLSQQTGAVGTFMRRAHDRFPQIVSEKDIADVDQVLAHISVEARRTQLLYNWIERTMSQPVHLGFAYGDLARQHALPNADQYLEGWVTA